MDVLAKENFVKKITKMFVVVFLILFSVFLLLKHVFIANAIAPDNIISYQGRLLNTNGVPVTVASANVVFEIFDSSTVGTCLWSNSSSTCATSTARVVTLTDGLFSEDLGDTTNTYAAIPDSVFANDASVYLQVTVEGEALLPRKRLTSAPYAVSAQTLDGIDSTGFLSSTGDVATGDYDLTGAILLGANPLVFEGLTNDAFQTTLAVTDPTGANTVTLPDGSGTLALTSDISAINFWTDAGTVTYLTSTTDDFAVGGTATISSPFAVDEANNTIYVGEGANSNGKIIMKALSGATGTLAYNVFDRFDFSGGDIYTDSNFIVAGGNITTPATTFNLDVADTGTILLRDGTNTLFSVVDAGSVGNATVTGGLTVNSGNITSLTSMVTTLGGGGSAVWTDGTNNLMSLVDNGTTGTLTVSNLSSSGTVTAGSISCTDCLDYSELADTMTYDNFLVINQGANTLTRNYTGTLVPGLTYNADSVSSTLASVFSYDGLTSGAGMFLGSTSGVRTSGDILRISNYATYGTETLSGSAVDVTSSITNNTASTTTHSADTFKITRFNTTSNAGSTINSTGSVLDIINGGSQTAGSLVDSATVLKLSQNYAASTGPALEIVNSGFGESIFANAGGFTVAANSNILTTGDLAVNGGDITTTATTWNMRMGNTGVLNFTDGTNNLMNLTDAGTIGNLVVSGNITANSDLAGVNATLSGRLAVNGGNITTSATALNMDVGNTGTFRFRDGTNTLFKITDVGTTGNITTSGDLLVSGGNITLGTQYIFTGGNTAILSNVDGIDATTETTIETAIDTLTNLTAATSLASVGTLTSGATGAGFTVDLDNSTLTCTDCLDYTEFADTMTLDANATTNYGLFNKIENLDSTGDFILQDNGLAFLTVNDDQTIFYSSTLTSQTAWDIANPFLTTGVGSQFRANQLTTGTLMNLSSLSTSLSTAKLLNIQHTANYSATTNVSGNVAEIRRTLANSAGTLTISGSLLSLVNNNAPAGGAMIDSANILSINQTQNTSSGNAIVVSNAGTGSGVSLIQNNASSNTSVVDITNYSTGNGININSVNMTTGNGIALSTLSGTLTSGNSIDSQETGNYSTTLTRSGSLLNLQRALTSSAGTLTVSGPLIKAYSNNSATTGTLTDNAYILDVEQLNTSTGATVSYLKNDGLGIAKYIWQTNALAGNPATYIRNFGVGPALKIDQTQNPTGINNGVLDFSTSAITTGQIISIDASSLTDGKGIYINTTNTLTDAGTGGTGPFGSAIMIDHNAALGALKEVFVVQTDINTVGRTAFSIQADGDVAIGQGALCVDLDGYCNGGVDGTIYYRSLAAGASDLAEVYPSTEALQAGDIVVIDSASAGGIKKSTKPYEQVSISAIATDPASVMGAPTEAELLAAGIDPTTGIPNWGNYMLIPGTYPVALAGRIPVKVNIENGNITVGDAITTSSVAGVGMKSTKPGAIIGRALESWTGPGQGVISVFIEPGWSAGDSISTDGSNILLSDGTILTSIGVADAVTTGYDSQLLTLRGSGWDGVSSVNTEMQISNKTIDSLNYGLSISNGTNEVANINNNGDLAISGRLYPSDQGVLQTNKYIYYESASDYMRTNAAGWATGSYDFAEMFPSPDVLTPGEVVVFGTTKESVVRSSGNTYDQRIAGIASTRPGFLAGENRDGDYPIALAGRVPTFVNGENGDISIGDPLTTSSKAGYAMKATEAGPIVGYAMEAFSGTTGSIIVFVKTSYYDGNPSAQASVPNNNISGVSNLTDLNVTGALNMNGGSIVSVGAISGIANTWRIDSNGDIFTAGRIISLIKSYQNQTVEAYPALGRESTIQLSGTVTLQNGAAIIDFEAIDPQFNDIIASTVPYKVFLTASSPTNSLYAMNRTNTGFEIRESNGGSNSTVDWLVIAYHKDFVPQYIIDQQQAQQSQTVQSNQNITNINYGSSTTNTATSTAPATTSTTPSTSSSVAPNTATNTTSTATTTTTAPNSNNTVINNSNTTNTPTTTTPNTTSTVTQTTPTTSTNTSTSQPAVPPTTSPAVTPVDPNVTQTTSTTSQTTTDATASSSSTTGTSQTSTTTTTTTTNTNTSSVGTNTSSSIPVSSSTTSTIAPATTSTNTNSTTSTPQSTTNTTSNTTVSNTTTSGAISSGAVSSPSTTTAVN